MQVPGRWRTIKAHGKAVGLPSDDDMGNSEVGAGGQGLSARPYYAVACALHIPSLRAAKACGQSACVACLMPLLHTRLRSTRPCLLQVGHNALGAGQLIDQGASLVDNALRTGSMFSGEGWQVGARFLGVRGSLLGVWGT